MKLKITRITFALSFLFGSAFSQIKVYSGGNIYVGSTTSTGPTNKLQVVGNSVFTSGTGTITSAPYLKGTNTWSNATSPDYSWSGSTTTGIFHTGANMIGFSTNGTERFRINSTGKLLNGNSSSTAGTPDYAWKGDTATGIFHPSNNNIGFTINGTEKLRVNSLGKLWIGNTSSLTNAPDYSWKSDTTTGISHLGTGIISLCTSASERLRVNSNGQLFSANAPGTSSAPDYSWLSETNTGMYRTGTNSIGFSCGGSEKMRISSSNNIQINTTTVNTGKLNIVSSNGTRAVWCEYTTNADWQQSIATKIDRGNSCNYVVNQGGTDNFYVAGAGWIYSQGMYLGSDMNLKDNVNTISSALLKINAMRGVTYNLKTEKNDPALYGLTKPNTYMGIIAQEVEVVAPELVRDMPNGTKAVAYQNMVGLLIEAIKEQSTQIEQLKLDMAVCCAAKSAERTLAPQPIENLSAAKTNNVAFLDQNRPNPFSQSTTISYFVPDKADNSSILVFDMNGKLLKTFAITAKGEGNLVIDAKQLQAGMYLYTLLIEGKEVATKRMILTDK